MTEFHNPRKDPIVPPGGALQGGGLPARDLARCCEIGEALERTKYILPDALHLQTDRLTGMYLKNILYSPIGRALIDQTVVGPKRFVLLDCQHAGAANSHGAEERINQYFVSLRGIFHRAALEVGIPHIPIRLGGDEFALVIPASDQANSFLRRVAVAVESSRARYVGSGSDELGSFVVQRDTVRMLRNTYRRDAERTHRSLSPGDFRAYLESEFLSRDEDAALSHKGFAQYLSERGLDTFFVDASGDPRRRELLDAAYAGFLQRYVGLSLMVGMRAPAGRFSMCSVDIGGSPRWEDYHLAEGIGAKRIQATKEKVFTLEIEPPVSVNSQFVVKSHEAAAYRAFLEREEQFTTLRRELAEIYEHGEKRTSDLYKLTMLAVSDPNLTGVLRGDLVRDLPAEVILGRKIEAPLSLVVVNVPSFGVFNNSKSYGEADRMLGAVVEAVTREFPACAIVREGGGRLAFLGEYAPPYSQIASLSQQLDTIVWEHFTADPVAYQRMLIEFGERIALSSKWRSEAFVVPELNLGSCSVGLAMIRFEKDAPFNLGQI